ncbi:MAG: putative helicase, partial [Pirellulaceae bacterium]
MSTARKQTTESFAELAKRALQLKAVFANKLCLPSIAPAAAKNEARIVDKESQAEEFAQAAAFWEYLNHTTACCQRAEVRDWIATQLSTLSIQFILDVTSDEAPHLFAESPIAESMGGTPVHDDWMFQCYEQFLQHYYRDARSSRGVFYTPRELVRFILRQVDATLAEDFNYANGLACTNKNAGAPAVRVLDPAMGTGIFLTEAVELLYRHHPAMEHNTKELNTKNRTRSDWSHFISTWLAEQFCGIDVSLPPLIVAVFRLAEVLDRTEYEFARFRTKPLIQFHWQDALSDAEWVERLGPFSVIIGNPPYRSLSTNESSWVRALLHGNDGRARPVADYYEVEGKPLGERKVWLHDDYVKFIRLAHWLVERNDSGLVAFVTNHGFLDNPTFRGMRYQLLKTFNRIRICDLHGSTKKKESSPDGSRDQNVFPVESGVAVGVFSRIKPNGG